MRRTCCTVVCVLAAACAPKSSERADVATGSVTIPDTPKTAPDPDSTPAPSSNEGPRGEVAEVENEDDSYDEVGPSPIWGHAPTPTGPMGGPVCDQAADCCLKMLSLSSPNSSLMQTCDTFRNAPTSACQGLLSALTQSAPQMGVACP